MLTLLQLHLQISFHPGEWKRSSSLSFFHCCFFPAPIMQPDIEAEKNDMPTSDCSFITAYYQRFWPKLPAYCTHKWAISIQLQVEEVLPEWLGFQTARSPLVRPVPWPLSHYKQRQLQGGQGHSASVGMVCRTRWAGGRLHSTVANGKVKELFQDESALEADTLHWHGGASY